MGCRGTARRLAEPLGGWGSLSCYPPLPSAPSSVLRANQGGTGPFSSAQHALGRRRQKGSPQIHRAAREIIIELVGLSPAQTAAWGERPGAGGAGWEREGASCPWEEGRKAEASLAVVAGAGGTVTSRLPAEGTRGEGSARAAPDAGTC